MKKRGKPRFQTAENDIKSANNLFLNTKNTVISISNDRYITVYFFVLITTHFLMAYSYASFVPLCG